jgi:hypothetical protein
MTPSFRCLIVPCRAAIDAYAFATPLEPFQDDRASYAIIDC